MSDKIGRSDIEKKLRQIKGEVDDTANTAKPVGITMGASLLAGVVGIAFVLGQRKARKRTTVVEVRRV